MVICLEHVENDPGAGRPGKIAWRPKARAAREGMSLSDFLKKELARVAERPTMSEWLERSRDAKPIRTGRTPAQVIRELRDSR